MSDAERTSEAAPHIVDLDALVEGEEADLLVAEHVLRLPMGFLYRYLDTKGWWKDGGWTDAPDQKIKVLAAGEDESRFRLNRPGMYSRSKHRGESHYVRSPKGGRVWCSSLRFTDWLIVPKKMSEHGWHARAWMDAAHPLWAVVFFRAGEDILSLRATTGENLALAVCVAALRAVLDRGRSAEFDL